MIQRNESKGPRFFESGGFLFVQIKPLAWLIFLEKNSKISLNYTMMRRDYENIIYFSWL